MAFEYFWEIGAEVSETGRRLADIRRSRLWTQAKLAEEAGVSQATISGIEAGKVSRPHFSTIKKLARALEVPPEEIISDSREQRAKPGSLSLEWALSAGEEELDLALESSTLESLNTLFEELENERERLQKLYREFPEGSKQRRLTKRQIREVAGHLGSVKASMMLLKTRRLPVNEARGCTPNTADSKVARSTL